MSSAKGILLFVLLYFQILSCQNNELPIIEANTGNGKDIRLGESDFYLKLPNGFEISEAHGKEGQLGYNIIPKDTTSNLHGSIEIERGNPVGEGYHSGENSKRYKKSSFLNKIVTWKIYQTETKRLIAYTKKGSISADVSARNNLEVDSMIAIIATLREIKE
jgi:hypothetical protein